MVQSPIAGQGVTVEQLFNGRRYHLGDYQREYSWSQEAVRALLSDLYKRFAYSWQEGHPRGRTQSYEPYFLGAYVFHQEDGYVYLVDGQQRVTTLHLLLIYLRRLLLEQESSNDASSIEALIVAHRHGRPTYTIDIEERAELLTALKEGEPYALPPQASPSLRNMQDRYQDIDEFFPEELRDERLPLFCDWLLERVCLVGIQATGRDNGWEIFESMNNRGVPLGPIDLLKSHLLYSADRAQRSSLNREWRQMLSSLNEHDADQPNTASRFVKTLLIAKYANLDDGAQDREQIDKSFHEWVRSHERDRMGLNRAEDFENLITMFGTYAEHYKMLVRASYEYEAGGRQLRSLYFNRHNGLEFQFPLIFATLQDSDTQPTVKAKAELIGTFLDCVYVRRIVNNNSSVDRFEFDTRSLILRLRETDTVDKIRGALATVLYDLASDLSEIRHMTLGQNGRQVKYVLARLTAFVDEGCHAGDRCNEYLDRDQRYQIEHIWSKGSSHRNIENFALLRHRLGGLLLLPASDNASYGADPYEQKLEYYFRQNWLAASLHPKAYERTPRFREFKRMTGLEGAFRAYPQDPPPAGIEDRQELYYRLAEKVWDISQFGVASPPSSPKNVLASSTQTRSRYGISVGDLIKAGVLNEGDWLSLTRRDEQYWVEVLSGGRLRTQDGQVHASPSGAGRLLLGNKSCDGWRHWHAQRGGSWIPLKSIRQEAIDKGFL